MSFPGLLLLLTIMSIAGRGVVQIILVLGVAGGIPASRVVRGAVIGVTVYALNLFGDAVRDLLDPRLRGAGGRYGGGRRPRREPRLRGAHPRRS